MNLRLEWAGRSLMEVWGAPQIRNRSCRLDSDPRHRGRRRHERERRSRRQAPGARELDADQHVQLLTWAAARADQAAWAAYAFDWSTDYCSSSPDNPFGFPFSMPCARHDFGYRNYKAAGTLSANKSRLDSAFYEDLKRVCAAYSGGTKTSCSSTAWTYYQAVRAFG